MRGAEENQTLVFLDGIPLNDPTNSRGGAVDLSVIEPALIGSSAVVRGPPSVRYGPETLAGVLHLNSDRKTGSAFHVGAEAGGDDLLRGLFSYAVVPEKGPAFDIGGGYYEEGPESVGTHARRTFVRGSAELNGATDIRLSAWYTNHEAESFPDDSGGFLFADRRELEQRDNEQFGAALHISGLLSQGSWTVTTDLGSFDSLVVSPGVSPGIRDPFGIPASSDDTRFKRWRASAFIEKPINEWTFTGGVDGQYEDGKSEGFLDLGGFLAPTNFELDRTRVGGFAEATGKVAQKVTLIGGARFDHYDDGFDIFTGRLGAVGEITETTQWRVNLGNGFKPPSFSSLANPLVGNPDLKPERSETIDAGLRQTLPGGIGLIDFTVFASRYKDGIDFDPGPPPMLVNREEIRSRGAELAAIIDPSDSVSLSATITYNDATSEPDGERLRSRPQWLGRLTGNWTPIEFLTLGATVVFVGDVPDTSVPTGDVLLDSWTRVDLYAVWNVQENLDITLALDNAFDADYEEAIGFPSPGVRLRAGIRGRF
jgi:outer membrane receptor protein involved in Fe transport